MPELAALNAVRPSEAAAIGPRLCVILGSQRSGTTALGRALGAMPRVAYAGEVFHDVRGARDNPFFERFLTVPEANFFTFREDIVRRFETLSLPSVENQRAIWTLYKAHLFTIRDVDLWVIDVKYNSVHHLNPIWQEPLHWPGIFNILQADDTPIIHVRRDDVFAQAASAQIAAATGEYHRRQAAPAAQLHLKPEVLSARMDDIGHCRGHFESLLAFYTQVLPLTYERMYEESGDLSHETRTEVGALLGLAPDAIARPDTRKIGNARLSDQIINMAELVDYFEGHALADMIRRHAA